MPELDRKPKSRLTVVETVYHQPPDGDPIASDSRFYRWLATDEQPFVRHLTVDTHYKPLDQGWIDRAGMLVIHNRGADVVRVGMAVTDRVVCFAVVPPGESCRFLPNCLTDLRIIADAPTKAAVYIFPE